MVRSCSISLVIHPLLTALLTTTGPTREHLGEATVARESLAEATAIAATLASRVKNPLGTALDEAEQAGALVASIPMPLAGQEPSSEYEAAVEAYGDKLLALASFPDSSTVGTLAQGIQHESSEIRLAALSALKEGALSGGGAAVLSWIQQIATSDPSPVVRREAFEVFCRWGNQSDVYGLATSLGRNPGPVQDLAVREWIRLEKERIERAEGADVEQVRQAMEEQGQ